MFHTNSTAHRPLVAVLSALAAVLALAALAAPASAMRSTKIAPHVCETTGGGKIVPIPGFPGERIDRRLLDDIAWLKRRFDVFIYDGYSNDPVHASNGEHPMGLALDIGPSGRRWGKIDKLAKLVEPVQNQPKAPFRWVGYNGDAGHGTGNHLHLSWNHGTTRPGHIADTVYTRNCPGSKRKGGGGGNGDGGNGGAGGGHAGNGGGNGGNNGGGNGGHSGGVSVGSGGGSGSGSGGGGGGIGAKLARTASTGPVVVESGGVGARQAR